MGPGTGLGEETNVDADGAVIGLEAGAGLPLANCTLAAVSLSGDKNGSRPVGRVLDLMRAGLGRPVSITGSVVELESIVLGCGSTGLSGAVSNNSGRCCCSKRWQILKQSSR
jgi:hypothetical protein